MINQQMAEAAIKPFNLDCRSEPVPWTALAKSLNQCRVGLILRELEAAGLSTVGISLMQGITAKINPPRTLAVRFPLGRVTGPPFDHHLQSKVVSAAFEALQEMKQPGTILKLDHKYPEGQRG